MAFEGEARNGASNGSGGAGDQPSRPDALTILLILEDEANRRSTRAALTGMAGVEIGRASCRERV